MIGNIKQQGVDINLDMVMKGMKDAYSGGGTAPERRGTPEVLDAVSRPGEADAGKARAATAEANKKEGEAFLAENRNKEGVLTLPSGLQYRVLKTGDGKLPTEADTVECHYRGTLINGTQFDSSYDKGRPATFKVSGVIPGWREALKLMPVGSKWELFVPSELAYGERGSTALIGPNATLLFEVELLAIK